MDPFDDKHRRKNPFNLIDDKFDQLFDELFRMPGIREKTDEIFNEINMLPGRNVHGFCVEIRPDGKTRIHEFGKRPSSRRGPLITDEHKPTSDIVEGKDEVAVTVDIPGVEREDIDINITKDSLEITVDNPKMKYHKLFDLPCSVKPKTMKSTYKNGVLDVIVKKR